MLAACSEEEETTTVEETTTEASGITITGAPEGFEATPPGTRLEFGETAYVVSQALASTVFYEVTVKVLGSTGPEDEGAQTFRGSVWTPIDDRGEGANYTPSANAPILCDIHEADILPTFADETTPEQEYKSAGVGLIFADGSGIEPTGLSYEYENINIDGIAQGSQIFWN